MADTDPTDLAAAVRAFLGTRRARITPQQAGLPSYGDLDLRPDQRRR